MLKLFRRKASKNYHIRGTIRGTSVYESTGTSDRSAAEAIRIKREKEILDQTIFGLKSTVTFPAAVIEYIKGGGERRFLRPLVEHFRDTPLAAIDQRAIDSAARTLYPSASPATLNRQAYTPVCAVLSYAAARGLCEPRRIRRPRQPKGRVRWLTPEEADRLIGAASPHLQPLLIFLFGTGARLGEALKLQWRQVDLDRREVQFLETKNGDSRGVPLHDRVIVALEALPHREGVVFRRPDGQPYVPKRDSGGQIKTAFKGACRRAAIEDCTPHVCRHSWASWTYGGTRDLVALMELGGWRTESMVRRYAHLNVGHRAQTIAALPWPADARPAQSPARQRGRK